MARYILSWWSDTGVDLHDTATGETVMGNDLYYYKVENPDLFPAKMTEIEEVVRKLNAYEQIVSTYASIFPEKFPPGHELHDADHMYWDAFNEGDDVEAYTSEPFQWNSETIEWVAADLSSAVEDDPRIKED